MPRGRKAANRPQTAPDIIHETPSGTDSQEVTLDSLNRSMMHAISKELSDGNVLVREAVINAIPDYLETLNRIAHGIQVQKYNDDGEPYVYSVPPFWPAIKYILDWGRKLAQLDPTQAPRKVEHGLDDETRDFFRQFMNPVPPKLPELTDGVMVLADPDQPEAETIEGEYEETAPESE